MLGFIKINFRKRDINVIVALVFVFIGANNIVNAQNLQVTEKYINDKISKIEVYRPGGGFGIVPLHSVNMDSIGVIHAVHNGKSKYTFEINPETVYYMFNDKCSDLGATSQLVKIKCNSTGGYSCIGSLWSGVNISGSNVTNQSSSADAVVIHFNLTPSSFDAMKIAIDKYFQIAREKYELNLTKMAADDPFLSEVINEKEREVIKMNKVNGVYEVPITLNGAIKLNFVLDSGAGDVFISPDVLLTLFRGKTITQNDFQGESIYQFANVKTEKCQVYLLKSMQIGTITISNVKCAVANTIIGDMLLGQSFLERLGKYTIDYDKSSIVVH